MPILSLGIWHCQCASFFQFPAVRAFTVVVVVVSAEVIVVVDGDFMAGTSVYG